MHAEFKPELLTNPSAEESLLGACLLEPSLATTLEVEPEDFGDPRNRSVWSAMVAVAQREGAADVVLLEAELSRRGVLEQVGGYSRLADIAEKVPTATNASYYAKEIRKKRVTREVLSAAHAIRDFARATDGEELLAEAQALLSRIGIPEKNRTADLAGLMREECKQIGEDIRAGGRQGGLSTGLEGLDAKTGGLPVGLVSVVAGRPGMGKSTLALSIARHLASEGVGSTILSYEDPGSTFARRALGAESGVAVEKLTSRRLGQGDLHALSAALKRTHKGINFVRAHGLPIPRALRLGASLGDVPVRLVILDYIQNAARRRSGYEKREVIEEAMVDSQEFAAKEGLAVLVVSQLNRQLDRSGEEPTMADLRDSGSLEECAKLILALVPALDADTGEPQEGFVRAALLKNSGGEAGGAVTLRFDAAHARFREGA